MILKSPIFLWSNLSRLIQILCDIFILLLQNVFFFLNYNLDHHCVLQNEESQRIPKFLCLLEEEAGLEM